MSLCACDIPWNRLFCGNRLVKAAGHISLASRNGESAGRRAGKRRNLRTLIHSLRAIAHRRWY